MAWSWRSAVITGGGLSWRRHSAGGSLARGQQSVDTAVALVGRGPPQLELRRVTACAARVLIGAEPVEALVKQASPALRRANRHGPGWCRS